MREEAAGRLDAAKLKACENRKRLPRTFSARQLEVFMTISERTQAFYIKQGNTSENYDALVAEVAAKLSSRQRTWIRRARRWTR